MTEIKDVSWKLFQKTGSPAAYLLFSALDKDDPVDNGSGNGRKT